MSEENKEEIKEEVKEETSEKTSKKTSDEESKEESKESSGKKSKKDSDAGDDKKDKDASKKEDAGEKKGAPTSLIIEALIAVAAIVLIIVAVVINGKKKADIPSASSQTVSADGTVSVSVDNSELWTNTPAVPDSLSFNNLTEAECEAEVAAGTMIKLTTADGATVYVHNYDNSELFNNEAGISEADIDNVIKNQILVSYAETKETDHTTVQNMDSVSVNYVGKIDGVAFDGGTSEGQVLTVGAGGFIPGFEDGMLGMSVGESKDVHVTFPEEYHNPDVAGKDAVFTITINEILGSVTYPELSDQIATEVTGGQITTAAELRNYLKKSMASDKIMAFLDTDFYVSVCPEDAVIAAYNSQLKSYDQFSASSGMSVSDMLSIQGGTLDELKAETMANAVNSTRYNTLFNAIAESNGITVTDEDLTALATEFGYTDLNAFYQDNGATEESARSYILQDKIIDFLVGKLN